MWMVTEHLPNNRAVVEGIFQWTKPGDLLALKHHNYYGFDGHHQKLGDEHVYMICICIYLYYTHVVSKICVCFFFFSWAICFFCLFSA